MNDPLPRLSPSQTSGRFRNHRPVIMMLAVICHFTALPATADECTRLPAPAGGKLADFDQAILPLKSRRNLERHIRDDLCAKQNIYAFLTGETAYRYGGCFIPAREADGFWNANHQQSESLLWRFRTHCIHWAEKRYQSRLARLDTGERRSQKKKSLPGADRAPVKASRTQPPGGRQAAQAQKPPSRQQAITAALESHSGSKLQWPGAPARAQQSNPELAAYLFATELLNPGGETEAAAGHLQQHFDTMMGRPQVLSVTATGRDREYQVRIGSEHLAYTVDALVRSAAPPAKDSIPWILFTRQEQGVTPLTAVLQASGQTISTTDLESSDLPLTSLPQHGATRLAASAATVQVQLSCTPHDGGQSMPLAQCLKPDGEISVLTLDRRQRFTYADLSRRQRDYRSGIHPPFVLQVRTGSSNRRGEIRLKLTDTTQTGNPLLFDRRAIGRRDSLLVYSE